MAAVGLAMADQPDLAGIDARRTISLDRFIYGLGVRDIGEQTSIVLARAFETWPAFEAACLAAAEGMALHGHTLIWYAQGQEVFEGLTGALFKEFALTLAGAVVISGIVALTLSPMMCSVLLRHEENPSGLAHRLDQIFERLKQRYQRALHTTLDTRPVVLTFAAIVLCLIPLLLMFTEKELAPDEDQGIFGVNVQLPPGASLERTDEVVRKASQIILDTPGVEFAVIHDGFLI